MKITKLEAENVKRLVAVSITPDGNMVVIGGKNGAGKSSILDSIEYALGGKRHICEKPLRNGTESGHIILETEKYIVKRTFTADGGGSITVKSPDGRLSVTKPQDLLDALMGDLSFDPLAFTRMDSKKQAETFMRLLSLDFTALDGEYLTLEQERRDINRDARALKSVIDSIPADPDAPTGEVVVGDLLREIEAAREVNSKNNDRRDDVREWEERLESLSDDVEKLKAALEGAQARHAGCTEKLADAREAAADLTDMDIEPLLQQVHDAEDVNRRVRAAQERSTHTEKFEQMRIESNTRTARLEAIIAEKAAAIAAAKFPVEEVTFTADGVLVNSLPFDQASSAEQLKIAVAMGLSAKPELKIVLIRDGSLLDEESLAAVAEMAETYDAGVWLERVGEGKEVSIVIEDGMVKEDRTKTETEARDAANV